MAKYQVKVTENVDGKPNKVYVSEPLETTRFDDKAVKKPFADLPIPEEACGWIGKLAFTWGYFELELDRFIVALEKETDTDHASLKQSFKKRKERCRDLSKVAFAANPTIHDEVASILGSAADLHWRRNVIVHGSSTVKLKAMGPKNDKVWIEYDLVFKGDMEGKKTSLHLKANDIERLYYQIGHLAGRLVQMINPDDEVPGLASEDKERRQAFLRATRLRPSIRPAPGGPQQASQA